jgi:hypothetical protein
MDDQKEDRVEISLVRGDMSATIRGPQEFVSEQAERIARVMAGTDVSISPVGSRSLNGADAGSERQLIELKQPQGQIETAVVLAFFLTEHGHKEFTARDLWNSYIRANIRPPKSVPQAARDAKSKHGLLESGSKKGKFRLSALGERFVRFDLPHKFER